MRDNKVALVEHICGWPLSRRDAASEYSDYHAWVYGDSSYVIAPENFKVLDRCPNCELEFGSDDTLHIKKINNYDEMLQFMLDKYSGKPHELFDKIRAIADDEIPYPQANQQWMTLRSDPRGSNSDEYAFDGRLVDLIRKIPGIECVRSLIEGGDEIRTVSRYCVYLDYRYDCVAVLVSLENTLKVFYEITAAIWERSRKERIENAELINSVTTR